VDPEKKRAVIGRMFIELFEREAKTFGADHLVQGRSPRTGSRAGASSGTGSRLTIMSAASRRT